MDRRAVFLGGPILPTVLRLSWPNILVMLAQQSTGLIETWWISHLGTDALAGMAIVFPVVMLMQMMSQGAMGGGISSAIARVLGAGRQEEADAYVLHALLINVLFGAFFLVAVLSFGRPLYTALGGQGESLDAALKYSNVVFGGVLILWVMNALASVIRGTGNMLVPAAVICGGVVFLIPVSPLLIFGLGPFPALGIAGGGVALLLYYVAGTVVFAWYILSGRNGVRLRKGRLQWPLFREILRVGAAAALSSIQTNLTIAITTALVGAWFGAADVAGYGTAARLEYLLSPMVFGIGGTLVSMVGMNVGAGQQERALRIAFVGGATASVDRSDRSIRRHLAGRVALVVRLRTRHAASWQRLSAGRWSVLRLLWAWFRVVLRIPGRRKAALAVAGRLYATSDSGGRRVARAAPHRITFLAFCRPSRGIDGLRNRDSDLHPAGRMVAEVMRAKAAHMP
jgi:putative MATE family efflux protein